MGTTVDTAVPPQDTPEARAYNRTRRRLSLADTALGFAMLVVLLATGWTYVLRDAALHGSGGGFYGGLALYVLMLLLLGTVLGLPLEVYGFRLEHRYKLSNQSAGSWLADNAKGTLLSLVFGVGAAELVYWLLRVAPQTWWLIAWAAFLLFGVLLAQLAPVLLLPLFFKFVPLEDEGLKQRLIRLGERAGTRVRGVFEWKLSAKSKKANAALAGLGRTRRIILADTLLQQYTPDEIEAVLAHELGHHVHNHILKSIAVQAVVSFAGFWAADRVLHWAVEARHWYASMSDFADIPLLVLLAGVLSFLLLPVLNAWSRHNERQADLYCWRSVPSVEPFVTAMNKLNAQNLGERSPSRWVEVLFHSHPPVSKRIAAAERYALTARGRASTHA